MQLSSPSPVRATTLLIMTLVSLCGCDRKTSDRDLVFVDPFQAVEALNKPASGFSKRVQGVFVDGRSPAEFAAGHIAGAINLPFPSMTSEASLVLAPYNAFVVYGTDYQDIIAVAASKRLMELGFDNVSTLSGGLKAWQTAGNPVETGVPAPAAAPQQ